MLNINQEIELLITLPTDANDNTTKLTAGYSINQLSLEEFNADLLKSINPLRQKDLSVIDNSWDGLLRRPDGMTL